MLHEAKPCAALQIGRLILRLPVDQRIPLVAAAVRMDRTNKQLAAKKKRKPPYKRPS